VLGREIPTLGKVDTVLAHVVHAAAHEWHTLESIAAISALLDALTDREASGLLTSASSRGCLRRLSIGVRFAEDLAGSRVPRALSIAAQADGCSLPLAREVFRRRICATSQPSQMDKLRSLVWQARVLDDAESGIRHFWRRLTTPGARDWGLAQTTPSGLHPGRLALFARRITRLWYD
jgi:hypothetical protein